MLILWHWVNLKFDRKSIPEVAPIFEHMPQTADEVERQSYGKYWPWLQTKGRNAF